MHGIAELRRRRGGGIVARRFLIARLVAVCAPVALVRAALAVEYDHTAIGVAVGGEDFLGRHIDSNVGGRAEPISRVAVAALARLADLQHEFAVHRELEQLAVLAAVAGEPDELIAVDENAVLALGPLIG